uniref:Uncharacterized protein n=1 Tax=Rheinheimera sp. BAL341 TaxID=1708203 RepID=A0A486XKS9_9GAMM
MCGWGYAHAIINSQINVYQACGLVRYRLYVPRYGRSV